MSSFKIVSNYNPCGDQPQAIEKLVKSVKKGNQHQTLLGVTGSGKTFTMANVISQLDRPTLIVSHNKTLAAQLYSELKGFFPQNAVEYFISYYDYYQPEAYIPQTDTYIEKDASINEDIERLRLAATSSLVERRDVIVIASVSCIYGLGSPEDYQDMMVTLKMHQQIDRKEILRKLIDIQYGRNQLDLVRGSFRVRGDVIEIAPSYSEDVFRVDFFGDKIEKIERFNRLTGKLYERCNALTVYPAKHFVTPANKIKRALVTVEEELNERLSYFRENGKLLEAQRLETKTRFDMEMLQEIGYCQGVENYSRHLSDRKPGERPYTLIDFFPEDLFVILDESHVSLPQVRAMYRGDRTRKETLVEHGFRLPSALDNRPLRFDEFELLAGQVLYVSATPGPYELEVSANITEQVIRPTGLVDPEIVIKPLKGQVDDLIEEIRLRIDKKERVLVTTLTKKMSEDLTEYLQETGIRVRYLHSEIDAIKRVEILRGLRKADFDVLVGINLLREGLDLPEVSLVAVLDADKEGFLRSQTSLIQVAGRASRHISGKVIMYADKITESIRKTVEITERRRKIQLQHNNYNNITPKSITRAIDESLVQYKKAREMVQKISEKNKDDFRRDELIYELEAEMQIAAASLEFERAAEIRDKIYSSKDSRKKSKNK
ncbi:MAG: excinuclease ABC subunit UvrB [Candidatus Theseobacter exili]|nr:excinuclease ABC subunit UvrB [Candidatus Theseobacter exili]